MTNGHPANRLDEFLLELATFKRQGIARVQGMDAYA
jgi:hypothetical protein